eukprot:Nitzschia sp. Nitz4//scaffold166_size90379//31846//32911//NITZ4_005053-RA/size90379-snap-gene-0.55-mRNA-1//-1//CDS//3329538184//5649//frame0
MTTETDQKQKEVDNSKKVQEVVEKLQGLAKPALDALVFIIPLAIQYGRMARTAIEKMPVNAMKFAIGFIFCFFGGLYPVVFASIQAAEHGGRKAVFDAFSDIADEVVKVIEASKKDDKVDDDKDGVADVQQITSKEFVRRKTILVLQKMDPQRIDKAFQSLYQVWLAVAAVLTIEFARAVSLALSISEFMKQPVDRYIAPSVKAVVPKEYAQWVPVVLGWICKSIGLSLAWYIQSIRSAFASALSGGLLMARAAYAACILHDIRLGGLIKDNHEDTRIDEYMSYAFAGLGFGFQLMLGFDMPFPFSLVLFPFEISEWALRWSITSGPTIVK